MTIATEFPTYAQLLAQVEMELDTEGEVFIQPEEMKGYANQAVDAAEKLVHGIYEDYFLDRDSTTLVSGTEEYALPSKIYAHKIRAIVYRNGSRVYTIKRCRDVRKIFDYEVNASGSGSSSVEYQYLILNSTAGAPKFILTPTPTESGAYVKTWYLRQANRFVDDTDVLDIPEAKNYVIQFMKVKCYEKEGHPNLIKAMQDLAKEEESLVGVLTVMVPDMDNNIEMDTSIYEEMN